MTIEKDKSYTSEDLFLSLISNYGTAFAVNGSGQGDDNLLYTGFNGSQSVLNLWQHATTDGAVSTIAFKVRSGDDGNDTVIIVRIAQNTLLLK